MLLDHVILVSILISVAVIVVVGIIVIISILIVSHEITLNVATMCTAVLGSEILLL